MNSEADIHELDAVALLVDIPDENLVRGQVGTVVDLADNGMALVEFSDDKGNGLSFVTMPCSLLLPLS